MSSVVVVPQLLSVETSARVLAGGTDVPTFRVIEANVRFRGTPPAEAIEWLRDADADFVGLVEFNSAWADAMEALEDLYPYSSGTIDDRTSGGTALFSKYPLVEARTTLAPTGIRTIVEAIARRPEGYVRILVVHPLSPTTPERAVARDEELAWIAERCATSDLPVIVVGDFNETPFGDAYRAFVDRSGLRSAHEGFGHVATWPARVNGRPVPNVLRIAIDHCFVSKHFTTRDMSVGPDIMSDHRPIVSDLAWSRPVR
jgi:endonuclease/exonuclease/phosphatase (EEP) superfamily protein YafD